MEPLQFAQPTDKHVHVPHHIPQLLPKRQDVQEHQRGALKGISRHHDSQRQWEAGQVNSLPLALLDAHRHHDLFKGEPAPWEVRTRHVLNTIVIARLVVWVKVLITPRRILVLQQQPLYMNSRHTVKPSTPQRVRVPKHNIIFVHALHKADITRKRNGAIRYAGTWPNTRRDTVRHSEHEEELRRYTRARYVGRLAGSTAARSLGTGLGGILGHISRVHAQQLKHLSIRQRLQGVDGNDSPDYHQHTTPPPTLLTHLGLTWLAQTQPLDKQVIGQVHILISLAADFASVWHNNRGRTRRRHRRLQHVHVFHTNVVDG